MDEDDKTDSDEGQDLRRGVREETDRLKENKGFNEKPAAYQRAPDHHHGHNHQHGHNSHGPTVDPAVIKLLTYTEISYPFLFDIVTILYGLLMVFVAFLGFHFRESIIIESSYEKFQSHLEQFSRPIPISIQRLIPEAVKYFSLCAYDILIIMYLIKPIKARTSEEKEVAKEFQTLVKGLGADRTDAQDKVKKIENLQGRMGDMVAHRFTAYNATMLQELKLGLSLDFILAIIGMITSMIMGVSFLL